jgi:predicted CoA-substrate-specific enzyme activase
MDPPYNILAVDIGSVSIGVVEINASKKIISSAYVFHQGKIVENLCHILEDFDLSAICGIASTTSTPDIIRTNGSFDNRVAMIEACRQFNPSIGSILMVGGEKFGVVRFDDEGNYTGYKANTSCAAGTGSFLDQQAQRLNLGSIEELSRIAFENDGALPKIASRCAVFAKTDLVHAQQEGYTLDEICDGLCYGLAKNIVDTLFVGESHRAPIIFTGGVSKNQSVAKHISSLVREEVVVNDMSHLFGAIGAGLSLMAEWQGQKPLKIQSVKDILTHNIPQKKYFHRPLSFILTNYPDFNTAESYVYPGFPYDKQHKVEVDIYEDLTPGDTYDVYLGMDIGSTSTKAVLLDYKKTVLAGFYTYTAGRPIEAVQNLFAAIDDVIQKKGIQFNITAAGTTGSGRKLAGKIIGSDLVIDEITAHARAAYSLDPNVDTIIEIGGQDSKFTTLKNQQVTFSIMNNVCAAGTGSFIEEQAKKLGCPLSNYSARTENQRAPITSDRCTVFMERDLNHLLSEGYSVDEVLASVLHAICENYLTKVAIENSIGHTVFFQGATAKNRALVAAFEQRLQKPIHVSRYCHLTGALGTALIIADQTKPQSQFRGINLYKKKIPVSSEVCELCTNHCKITVAHLHHTPVAYGFLCGRDYETKKFINNNRSGFDLLKERKKAFIENKTKNKQLTVGIPAALHLYEDLPLWEKFFEHLNIKTVSSDAYHDAVKEGKQITGAEFCAPMTAWHGHVNYLLKRADKTNAPDYIFLPVYLEKKAGEKGARRQYCYYTQYSTPLAMSIGEQKQRDRFLTPLVNYLYNPYYTKIHLYRILKPIVTGSLSFFEVAAAYDQALKFKQAGIHNLKTIYQKESQTADDIHVVLLGRPYTILSKSMNKGIPSIFAALGIRAFSHDMLSPEKEDVEAIESLLNELPWHYASEILSATEKTARTPGAYPVLVTSFKCSPDSFITEYFKKVMEAHDKPYLILQLDEHDSSVGYETRIEAGIRSFQNHWSKNKVVREARPVTYPTSLLPRTETQLTGKTLVIPNWDNISLNLIVANLRKSGIDARVLEETETSIQKSLRYNTGQCIPLNIIAQEFIDYVKKHHLDPAKTILWNVESTLACNLSLYPHHIRTILQAHGHGMEKAGVYKGALSFADISLKLPINTYFAYMFGGMLRKMGCKIRPYEIEPGITDRTIQKSIKILSDAFYGKITKEDAVDSVVNLFEKIETIPGNNRPKVAIFGDLYLRDNKVMNQDLIRFIERNGGEVITTPYSSYAKMVANQYLRKWFIEGQYLNVLTSKALVTTISQLEKTYAKYFGRILKEPEPEYNESAEKILSSYNIRIENTGESMDNIMKIYYLTKLHPEISLLVQVSPAFCCPALITEAMSEDIKTITGIPVVSITYDGTRSNKNDVIIPYLYYQRKINKTETLYTKH